MEEQLAKFQRWSNINVVKLGFDLDPRNNEMHAAMGLDERWMIPAELVQERIGKEVLKIRKPVTNGKCLKEEASGVRRHRLLLILGEGVACLHLLP
jgi:hypothetical protein